MLRGMVIERILALICSAIAAVPRPFALRIGRRTGWLLGRLARSRRREAEGAIAQAFPDRSPAEVHTIAEHMFQHLGSTAVEVGRLFARGRTEADRWVEPMQDESFRQLASMPGGALLLMGHIGNWELIGSLTHWIDRKGHAVVKPLKPAGLQRFMVRARGLLGLSLLNHRGEFGGALRALKKGDFVAVVLDQNQTRSHGIHVDFFGRPASTSPGLAILSRLAHVPVFPVYDIRRADGRHEIRVLPPIEPPPDREPETLKRYTQRYTAILESIIRQHPDQWIWIHRRWRTQPVSASTTTGP